MYEFLTPNEHIIIVRNRETGYPRQYRLWNMNVINKVLRNQKPTEDVYVTKYPSSHLIRWIILDFDSKDRDEALSEVMRMKNYLNGEGHNTVLVDSTNKGYHLYIQIAPFLFEDEGNRVMDDWKLYFTKFVEYFIDRSSKKEYKTLDLRNASAGLSGNIRLINSIHPSTQKRVEILEGRFDLVQEPTWLQDKAQRVAYQFCDIANEIAERKIQARTKVVDGVDPIENNDLRELMPRIFGEEAKIYPKGYGFMKCPFHNDQSPSLLLTHSYYSCASCGAKGNIFTLKKLGYVEFDINGVASY